MRIEFTKLCITTRRVINKKDTRPWRTLAEQKFFELFEAVKS